jgi:post-segregation antitoxin (ccd killing protein)
VHRLGAQADDRFFIYRGRRYADQPVWRTWLDHQLIQRARDIGIAVSRRPLLAVIASACDLRSLRWSEAERLATT